MTNDPSRAVGFRGKLGRALRLRCPLCGDAPIFERFWKMSRRCPSCGFYFERESGYWLGSMYVNYVTSAALGFAAHILMSSFDLGLRMQLLLISPYVIAFPLLFARHSRALWMALDLTLDSPKPQEYEAEGQRHRG